jgi:hypothetical protein
MGKPIEVLGGLPVVCTPFDRTGSLVTLSTEAKKFSWGEEFQA